MKDNSTNKWLDHSAYEGCSIQYRPGMIRRGYRVRIPNQLGSSVGRYQTHDSLKKCHENIDERIRIHGRHEPSSYTYIHFMTGEETPE